MMIRRLLTLALIAAGALPLVVFAVAFSSVLGEHISGDIRSLSSSMLRTLNAQAGSSLIDGTRRDLPTLLILAETYPGRERELLRSFGIPHGEYARLLVLDSARAVVAAYPPESAAAGRSYALRSAPALGSVVFSDAFRSELTGSVVVEASYSNGRRTVVALLDLGAVSSRLVLAAQSPADRLGVVDGEGRYIACSDPSRAQRLERVAPSFLVDGPARIASGGRQYYASSARLPDTDWRVLYLRSAEEADAPMAAFMGAIFVLVAASVVVTVFVAVFLWRTVSTPLGALVGRIDRIAEGRYGERVEGDFPGEFLEIGRAFNAMADSIERRDREILASEERYRILFTRSSVPALIVDPATGALADANDAAIRYYGYAREELLSFTVMDIDVNPGERLREDGAAASAGERGCFFSKHRLRSGEERDVEVYASPVKIGDSLRLHCVVFDVTQRRMAEERTAKALEERTLLLREVYHRVKNNLQIISSLLNLQAEGLDDGAGRRSLRLAQDRVFAMAAAHELAYQVPDLSYVDAAEYAGRIVSNLQTAYGAPEGSVLADLCPMRLPLEKAVPFGLALNELASNAFKYASPSAWSPVRVALAPAGEGGSAVLSVEDSGPGLPEGALAGETRAGSIGLSLISALARQLDGSASWEGRPGGPGTIASIRFSVAQRKEDP